MRKSYMTKTINENNVRDTYQVVIYSYETTRTVQFKMITRAPPFDKTFDFLFKSKTIKIDFTSYTGSNLL